MFELTTEASLLATFRYVDRKHVELSRDVTLPVVVNDYLTWAFGKRVFLVFALPGKAPRGIVFESNEPGPPVSHMCDWCHQVGLGNRVGLLTARRSRERVAGVLSAPTSDVATGSSTSPTEPASTSSPRSGLS